MVDYIIKVTYGANGKISPEGNVTVKEGTDKEFKVAPEKGYTVGKLLVDGEPAKFSGDVYTFINVLKNYTLDVTFIDSIDGTKPVKVGELTTSVAPTVTNLNVVVTTSSKATGGFAICPICGSTFGNIIYDKVTDHIKCLMCKWESGAVGTTKDPLKEIQDSLMTAKPIKPTATVKP